MNHGLRWGNSPLWYQYKRGLIETFITNRHPIVTNHLSEFLELWAQPVELVSLTLTELETDVVLQWTTEREEECAGFIVQRSIGSDGNFETIATWHDDSGLTAAGGLDVAASYTFTDTNFPQDEDLWYRVCWESNSNIVTALPWVETTQLSPAFALRLNEFMAVNNTTIADGFGEYDDWLELINPTDEAISTAGLFLSDDLAVPTKWALPEVTIDAHGFLLVWCDNDLLQGPLHAGFKISGSGESLGLYSSLTTGNLPIDTTSFGAQQADVSLSRLPDAAGPWVSCTSPTPGAGNSSVSAISYLPGQTLIALNAQPNPFNPSTAISFELTTSSQVKLHVFDMRGRLVSSLCDQVFAAGSHHKVWNGCDNFGQKVASGLYFAMIEAQHQTQTIKLVLLN